MAGTAQGSTASPASSHRGSPVTVSKKHQRLLAGYRFKGVLDGGLLFSKLKLRMVIGDPRSSASLFLCIGQVNADILLPRCVIILVGQC